MFKNNHKSNGAFKTGPNQASSVNIIGVETKIEGKIQSDSDIRIEGILKGSISTKSKVVVGITGVILGDVDCKHADISGEVKGTIKVDELLTLKNTANINGDITANKLVVEAGAVFNGNCTMGDFANEEEHEKELEIQVGEEQAV